MKMLVIRLLTSVVLLVFVYVETGWATTLVLALTMVNFELINRVIQQILIALKALA